MLMQTLSTSRLLKNSVFQQPANPAGGIRSRAHGRCLLPLLLGLSIGACTSLGPDFKKPAAPTPNQWSASDDARLTTSDPAPAEAENYRTWWQVFNDAALDTLIKRAYEQNLTLRAAGLRVLEARAVLGIAIGNRYPQLQQVLGSASRQRLSRNGELATSLPPALAGQLDNNFSVYTLGFDVAWEADFWGKFRRDVESAAANLAASVAGYDDLLVSLTGDVARAYALIRTLEERLKVAYANIAIQQRSLRIAQVRFDNGLSTELDVQQARALLSNSQALVPTLRTQRRRAKNSLSVLLGIPPDTLTETLGAAGLLPSPPAAVAIGVPAELLRRRPDIRRAELRAAAQSARIGIAKSDLYPSFVLAGSIGLRATDSGDLFSSDSTEGQGLFNFRWNILNYGRIKNNVRIQDARLQQLLINYQNTVLRAYREVEDALVGFLRAQERVAYFEVGVTAAKRSVDLALIQYRDGVVDYSRVLQTQSSLVAQQDALTVSRGDVIGNLVALYKGLGGGWQVRQGQAFVPLPVQEQMRQRTDWGRLLAPGEAERAIAGKHRQPVND